MNASALSHYLLQKPEAVEDYPFGPEAQVFKIYGKMFALVFQRRNSSGNPLLCLNLKCDPIEALELRDVFACVTPGYHMNKRHWNTVILDGSIPDSEIERMIDNSYFLVAKSLKKTLRTGLEIRHGITL